MRSILGLISVVTAMTAACGSASLEESCGTSEPAFAQCVPHGLDGLDLSGSWQLTGTRVSQSSTTPQTTSAASGPVTFQVNGCTLTVSSLDGTLDDTNARASTYDSSGSYAVTVCATADGSLAYHLTEGWDRRARGGNQGSATTSGTLTR